MEAFEEAYDLYFRDVYRYVFTLCRDEAVCEEVTQETFFKALKGIDNFHGSCSMRVWLCQIAKNTYFTHYKKEKRRAQIAGCAGDDQTPGPEQQLIDRETALAVHKRLHALDEPYKEVFLLRLFGELPFAWIADLFGKSESWARVTYYRAKLKIQEDLP